MPGSAKLIDRVYWGLILVSRRLPLWTVIGTVPVLKILAVVPETALGLPARAQRGPSLPLLSWVPAGSEGPPHFCPLLFPCCFAWPVASLRPGGIFTTWLTSSRLVMARFTKLSKNPGGPSKKVSLPMASSDSLC